MSNVPEELTSDVGPEITKNTEDGDGNIAEALECTVNSFVRANSAEELPENNVYGIHPRTKDRIEFGLHIEEHRDGCHVARVIENGLAFKSNLQDGDVITALNDDNLRGWDLEGIISHFSKIDLNEPTTLVIQRSSNDENDELILQEIPFIITCPDEHIECEVETPLPAATLRYSSVTAPKYIQYGPTGKSPRYIRVDDDEGVSLSSSCDHKNKFRMELYGGDSHRVCVMRNMESSKVLNVEADEIEAEDSNEPQSQETIENLGGKYFIWKYTAGGDAEVFESLSRSNHFLVVTEESKLALQRFSSHDVVSSEGKFHVINCPESPR